MLVLFSTSMALGLLALVVRFSGSSGRLGNSLCANAYGIYLVQWPIVLWLQFVLLWTRLPPMAKGALAMTLGFGLSWARLEPAPPAARRRARGVATAARPRQSRFAFRNIRMWRTASGTLSGVSFHG